MPLAKIEVRRSRPPGNTGSEVALGFELKV
jgi:hypothetical protein